MNEIVNQLCETMELYMAETGFPADGIEMSSETFEILKKECETVSPRSHEYHLLASMYGTAIFLNDEMETGKINVGRIGQFIQQRAYKETFERMRASVCEAEKATGFFKQWLKKETLNAKVFEITNITPSAA